MGVPHQQWRLNRGIYDDTMGIQFLDQDRLHDIHVDVSENGIYRCTYEFYWFYYRENDDKPWDFESSMFTQIHMDIVVKATQIWDLPAMNWRITKNI
jgi:hypothetical protein